MRARAFAAEVGLSALILVACQSGTAAQVPPPPPAPVAAPAAPQVLAPAASFQSRLDLAARQMDADPQAAIEALDHLAVESTELRKTRPLTDAERPGHRQLFILRARAHLQAMNNEKVDESFRELLRVDPFFSYALTPREQELLDGVRTRESGLLEVSSSVPGCRVIVDGIEIGVTGDTPVRASIVNGSYEVRLEKPGFQGAGTRVTVVATQTVAVTDLAPKPQVPPIAFLTDREGVEVSVDNARAGETVKFAEFRKQLSAEETAALEQAMGAVRFDPAASAGFLLRDPPVDRSLIVRFSGKCLIEESRTIAVTAEALAQLNAASALLWYGESSAIRMRPDVGTLRVNSMPADADVYLDGTLAGRTPFERSVCTGEHRVRVRHRIGSFTTSAAIARGRTEVVDVTLRPGLAFLGGVETYQGALRPSPELTTALDRALATGVKSFRLAAMTELPPEVQRWTDAATADLVAAAEKTDADSLRRLLRVASDNYDAPLMIAAVARGPAASAETPVELLVFWYDHAGVDHLRLAKVSSDALAEVIQQIDRPADPSQLVFQNDLGLRLVDTAMPDAPLVVVAVDAGSPAALAGIKAGDSLAAVDGGTLTASQLADLVRQKKPGDVLNIRVSGAGSAAKPTAIPVQRRPRRAPAFDPEVLGNAVMAKLQAAAAIASAPADRELLGFNLALVQMRFRQWRAALDSLGRLGQVPTGLGVGPGSVLYFRARCHEELGERERALALYREAAGADAEVFADDGATVAAVVNLRLAALGDAPRPPVVK